MAKMNVQEFAETIADGSYNAVDIERDIYGYMKAAEKMARSEVAKYLREHAQRHEHGASGSVIAEVLRECALAVEVTP